jgi:hypothetical protein
MVLLTLLLVVCFRRRKNKARRQEKYHSVNLHSPRSQSPIGPQHIGEPAEDNLTPFVPPTQSNTALAYYGNDGSSVQKTASSHPSSSHYRPRPDVYPQSFSQGMTTSTDQRSSSYSSGVVTPPPHFDSRPMSTLQTSTYDTGSRPATYAVQNPAPPQGGEGIAPGSTVTAADWKLAEARRQAHESQSAGQSSHPVSSVTTSQPSRPVSPVPVVFQHQDGGTVIELPPAYREYPVAPTAPPPP